MSARKEKIMRRVRRGGVLEYIPEGQMMKTGTPAEINGVKYVELEDGRIAKFPIAVNSWTIKGGKVVQKAEDRCYRIGLKGGKV